MSCHNIGKGMNSVVEVVVDLFERDEIDLNACKEIIRACKQGVYWCDGNSEEAIACINENYCGNCLKRIDYEEKIRVSSFRENYQCVTRYLCKDCYRRLVYENRSHYLKNHLELMSKSA